MHTRSTASGRDRATASRVRRIPQRGEGSVTRPETGRSTAPAASLRSAAKAWIADGQAQGWSRATIDDRRKTLERIFWWLENAADAEATLQALTTERVRALLAYARQANPSGRFGSNRPSAKREARPATVNAYFRILRAFLNFCREEGYPNTDVLRNVKAPRVPKDQIQPLSEGQMQALLDAARRSCQPDRNAALILVLLDTGLRISELLTLRIGDVDRGSSALTVTGKGNKKRVVYMGKNARRALWRYLEVDRREAALDDPLFTSVGGNQKGTALTPKGAHRIIQRAGAAAKIQGAHVSPHNLRRTFAVNFLRGGGNLLELQQLMGHEDLTVLQRYVALAETDLQGAHRNASPADRMKLK